MCVSHDDSSCFAINLDRKTPPEPTVSRSIILVDFIHVDYFMKDEKADLDMAATFP